MDRCPLVVACSRMAPLFGVLLLLTEPALAQMSSGSQGGLSRSSSSRSSSSRTSSSRSSRQSGLESSRSSRMNSRDNDTEDVGDESEGGRSSRSRSSRSSSSRSGSSGGGGTRSFSTGGSSGGGKGSVAPPIVFGTKYEREGVHPRGNLLSVATFEALPCTPASTLVGATTYFRCGAGWYQRIEHEGWTCYSEIWPPAGARVSSLPATHMTLTSKGRTLYASAQAWYERDPATGGYVVIEPPLGLQLDRLPEGAKKGIPIVVNGQNYYRHLGVFYLEQRTPGEPQYVVAKSPFDMTPLPGALPAVTDSATVAVSSRGFAATPGGSATLAPAVEPQLGDSVGANAPAPYFGAP